MTNRRFGLIVLSFLVVTALGALIGRAAVQTEARQAAAPAKQVKVPPMPWEKGQPLPMPEQQVAAVFTFAAEHPEVLRYVPCFCGCDHLGHKGNADCFVKNRAPNGDVVAWEPHGTECAVCLQVGYESMQMYAQGASVRDIRNAIDKKYAAASFRTPTPQPPK